MNHFHFYINEATGDMGCTLIDNPAAPKEGERLVSVPADLIRDSEDRDFSRYKAALIAGIDDKADTLATALLPTRMERVEEYRDKATEAQNYFRARAAGDGELSVDDYPFLDAEAQARGRSVDEIAQAVDRMAGRLSRRRAAIAAIRVTTKAAIAEAPDDDLLAIAKAADVDWGVRRDD